MGMREEFEAWYIDNANRETGMNMDVGSVAAKRGKSGDYAGYDYLHGCWTGWKGYASTFTKKLQDEGLIETVVTSHHGAGVRTK